MYREFKWMYSIERRRLEKVYHLNWFRSIWCQVQSAHNLDVDNRERKRDWAVVSVDWMEWMWQCRIGREREIDLIGDCSINAMES